MSTRLKKCIWMTLLLFLSAVVLGGCLYPQELKMKNQPDDEVQIEEVQNSVQAYWQDTGVLPIQTTEADTPVFQKYVLDFNRLIPRYLAEPPPNSFEAGGVYRYVLVDVESDPKVKLIDLRLSRAVQELQLRVNEYVRTKSPHLPVADHLGNGYFTLDEEKLNLDQPPQVTSPYSGQLLPLIINQEGKVGIDYRLDLNQLLASADELEVPENVDIRHLLVKVSKFVPAYSFPYKLEDDRPVFIESWNTKN